MKYASLVFLFLYSLSIYAQDGNLDNTFNGGAGYFKYNYSEEHEIAKEIVFLPDGTMLIALQIGGITNGDIMLMKRKANGAKDNSFSGNGDLMYDLGQVERPRSIVLLADGSFYLYGSSNSSTFITKFLSNGTIDNSFGDNGILYLNLPSHLGVGTIRLKSDGNFLGLGSTTIDDLVYSVSMVIDKNTGTLLSHYGNGGYCQIPFPLVSGGGGGYMFHKDTITYAGVFYDTTATYHNVYGSVKVTPKGVIDTSYGESGLAKTYFKSHVKLKSVGAVRMRNGNFVMGISIPGSLHNDYGAIGFLSNGEIDTTFATNGLALHDVLVYDGPKDVLVDQENRILLIGNGGGTNPRIVLIRLLSDGSLDPSFGNSNGIKVHDFGIDRVGTSFARITLDNKIILAGTVNSNFSTTDINLHISRYKQACDNTTTVDVYPDLDDDGYGSSDVSFSSCSTYPPDGYSLINGDCNDEDAAIYPNAIDICDGKDNDCNDIIDDNMSPVYYYLDNDHDGYGADHSLWVICDGTIPLGYVEQGGDCDDFNLDVYPGSIEICNNIDDNCDGFIDNEIPIYVYYLDEDEDGFGSVSDSMITCDSTIPEFYVIQGGDCDDYCPECFPGSVEVCDGSDNNCDGQFDEGLTVWYYYDYDEDGFGAPSNNGFADCPGLDTILDNYSLNQDDCAPNDPLIHPDAIDIPNNGIDENCDGLDSLTAVNDIIPINVSIYPNPANSCLNIDSKKIGQYEVTIHDIYGKLVYRETNLSMIDIKPFSSGVYLIKIRVKNTNASLVQRVVFL